jgi:hypothetical protein
MTTRADGENTGFAVWIPVASPSSLHSTIAFDLGGVVVGLCPLYDRTIRSNPHDPLRRGLFVAVPGRVSSMTVCVNFARVLKNLDKQTSRPLR